MHAVLVTPPAELPIEAADVIARAPSLAGANEDVVTALIEAAVSYLDGWSGILGRCLVEQTWRVDYEGLRSDVRLPFGDVLSVVSVKAGETVIPSEDYELRRDRFGWLVEVNRYPSEPPSPAMFPLRFSIEFTAGYGAPDKVPAAIKQAIVMMVAGMYATTEANGGLRSFQSEGAFTEQFNSPEMVAGVRSSAVDMLLAPFRRMAV